MRSSRRQDARIGEIRFDARDLFDTEAADEDTSVSRAANQLHVTTRQGTIEDQLLFKSGDLYRPALLEESARILRDTRYLRDAQIRPVAFHDGVVDIEVTTQDVWTFNPGISFGRKGGANTGGFELEELNFLGTGTQLGVGFVSGVDRDSKFIQYRDRQLGSSWWDLSTAYSDNSDGRLGSFPSSIRSTRSEPAGPAAFLCSTTSAPTRATTWARSSTSSRRMKSSRLSTGAAPVAWMMAGCVACRSA